MKTPERRKVTRFWYLYKLSARLLLVRQWRRSGVFIVNFGHIILVFSLLTLNKYITTGLKLNIDHRALFYVFVVDLEYLKIDTKEMYTASSSIFIIEFEQLFPVWYQNTWHLDIKENQTYPRNNERVFCNPLQRFK